MRYVWIVLSCFALMPAYGQKQKGIEYQLRRNATIEAMDSLFQYTQTLPGDKRPDDELLMKFADEKCKEFHNDTLLMSRLAEYFATRVGRVDLAQQRFCELKRIHPQYLNGYFNYASTMNSYGTKVTPEGGLQRQPEYRDLAKAQIDSAKAVAPNSVQPYLEWLRYCAPYAFSEAVRSDMDEEVEALNKAFPQANAYYRAAEILRTAKPAVQKVDSEQTRDNHVFLINRKALGYYEKINVETMTASELEIVSSFYYTSTNSPYLGRHDKLPLYERGAELARLGAEKFPDSIGFQRMLLWHNVEIAKIDTAQRILCSQEAHQAAERLFGSSVKLAADDYFYDGLALQNIGKYDEAISKYRDALTYPHSPKLSYNDRYHKCDSVTAMDNISDCYKAKKDYDNAIAEKKQLFKVREEHKGVLILRDMQNLQSLYRSIADDTLRTAEKRMAAFVSCDSIYDIIQTEIDAGNENYTVKEKNSGIYNRLIVRRAMDQIQPDRTFLTTIEMAEAFIDRVEPLETKSDLEQQWLSNAAWNDCVLYYNKQGDYAQCIKYADIAFKYAPSFKERYQNAYKSWKQKVRHR